MKPYYQDDFATLYLGDCREIMPSVAADVLVTDPPYGVNLGQSDRGPRQLAKNAYLNDDDSYESFVANVVPRINAALDATRRGAVFTGPHIHEQRKPDAIGCVFHPSAVGRHRWGFKSFLPVLLYGTAPGLQFGSRPTAIYSTASQSRDAIGHPVPKPLEWMRWLVDLAPASGETILDPFAGSGTTLIAAADLGRKSIGIEIEERYCEIAAKRLASRTLNLFPQP